MRDTDSRLQEITGLLREQNRLLSYVILLQYHHDSEIRVVLPPEVIDSLEKRARASNEPLPF